MSLRITVLAFFYESVKRRTKTKKIERKKDKINNTTNPSKIDAICAQNVCKVIFMLDYSILRTGKGNFS